MSLTTHQRLHVLQLLKDAPDMPTDRERDRVVREATGLLSGAMPWPDVGLWEFEINDWVEKPYRKAWLQVDLDERRVERGG